MSTYLNPKTQIMTNQPTYVKTASYMFIFSITIAAMVIGRQFLIPIVIAMLLSFLLLPISSFLERKGLHRAIAIVISLICAFIIFGGLIYFLYFQILTFADDGPLLKEKLNEKLGDLQRYIFEHFKVSKWEQNKWIKEQTDSMIDSGGQYLTDVFAFTGNFLASVVVLPIYIFFMTMYRDKVKKFICKITPNENDSHVMKVASKTAKVSQKYIQGLLIDIGILAVLNSIGFLILGIDYAILLGVLAAVLNLIPYIGVLIGSIFPIMIALLTKDSSSAAFGALGVCLLVQFLDNNFLTPKIVGSSVSINPLATLISIIAGGMIWGVAGMMLFIPLLGMMKVICDGFPKSQPIGFLIGEEEEMNSIFMIKNIKMFSKNVKIENES